MNALTRLLSSSRLSATVTVTMQSPCERRCALVRASPKFYLMPKSLCAAGNQIMEMIPVFHHHGEVALASKQLPSFKDVPAEYLVRNENPILDDASRLGVCL